MILKNPLRALCTQQPAKSLYLGSDQELPCSWRAFGWAESGVTILVASVVFLLSFAYFAHLAGDLPILREIRGFLFYRGWVQNISWWDAVFRPVGSYSSQSRIVVMLFMALQNGTCGFEPRCVNDGQNTLLAAAATLLFVHVNQLCGKRKIAFLVSVLWCMSIPAFAGALWQDTQFDKFAMIFSLLYLIILFHFMCRSSLVAINYISCNLLLFFFLFLA